MATDAIETLGAIDCSTMSAFCALVYCLRLSGNDGEDKSVMNKRPLQNRWTPILANRKEENQTVQTGCLPRLRRALDQRLAVPEQMRPPQFQYFLRFDYESLAFYGLRLARLQLHRLQRLPDSDKKYLWKIPSPCRHGIYCQVQLQGLTSRPYV